ncbi:ADP-ribosyl-[dinitrogen reductase] hydrolase [uncultured Desulfuromonas sp.]|uniref:ADP-ribosyl-[dinitrogen reductase] hydrolase n=1 Tax=uncultured Desulfuromonas sp. TaxID=181013 RepID=UPI002AAAC812|nr:ADP-ribosyl-[dinitrogen reductase] hydrolase [uncultured Desulfuromonas sp.]
MSLTTQHIERAQAAFVGLAVGDALGATTEFMTPNEIRARHGIHRTLSGGGWLNLKPGHVTDDTEMSMAIANAVLAHGEWNQKEIADAFVAWMKSKPIDIGSTVRKGIRTYMTKGTLGMPRNDWDAGNGAAMRMVPVAIYTLGDKELYKHCTLEQAHLTHNHPLSDAGTLCVGEMVQAAILGADRFQLHECTRRLTDEFPNFKFQNYRGNASGYIVDTLQTVFHYLFTTASFEECLVGIVNQGGDADTTGAIAGMIAGAFYGMDAIPRQWKNKLNKQVRHEVTAAGESLIRLSPLATRPQ